LRLALCNLLALTVHCHPDRSEAEWRDNAFDVALASLLICNAYEKTSSILNCHPERLVSGAKDLALGGTFLLGRAQLCHPDRSEAEWRDLALDF
jgi:hypothetical protein